MSKPRPHIELVGNHVRSIPASHVHAVDRRRWLDAQQRTFRDPAVSPPHSTPRPRRPA
jgi:hypothetical protein